MTRKSSQKSVKVEDNLMNNSLKVAMVVIGDEILNGRTTDLNANWLAKFLFKEGMLLTSTHFIRDHEVEIMNTLNRALDQADIVITSGGIGPTLDDMTKKCLAKMFGKTISENPAIIPVIEENYRRFGRTWNPGLNFYHHFPEDFLAINNPKGLAPGLGYYLADRKKLILSGPGVPREFHEMVSNEFFSLIQNYFSGRFVKNYQTIVRTHSVPEEKIFGELEPELWSKLEKFGKVSSLPHTIGIDIIISYNGSEENHQLTQQKIKEIFEQSKMHEFVWQYGNLSLSEMILKKATEKKITFGFAESCTGGLTSSKFTDLSGSSVCFMGTIVSYDNSIKEKFLAVKSDTLKTFGAVSEQTVKEMCEGGKKALNVDICVAITGIAGPTGGSVEKPVGTVYFGVHSKHGTHTETTVAPGDRTRKKDRFSDRALLLLLEEIQKF
jgi:nicotinamide-nucleotide amidase